MSKTFPVAQPLLAETAVLPLVEPLVIAAFHLSVGKTRSCNNR